MEAIISVESWFQPVRHSYLTLSAFTDGIRSLEKLWEDQDVESGARLCYIPASPCSSVQQYQLLSNNGDETVRNITIYIIISKNAIVLFRLRQHYINSNSVSKHSIH